MRSIHEHQLIVSKNVSNRVFYNLYGKYIINLLLRITSKKI